jgi:imidazole glycerol phosphate synthase subunit HisF
MRQSLLGALLGAVLVIAVTAGSGSTQPAFDLLTSTSPATQNSELITHVTAVDGQPLIVTVIDPRQRVMGVYQVERATGKITPMSVRNITWDLQMTDYNSGKPLPQDIRSGLQR